MADFPKRLDPLPDEHLIRSSTAQKVQRWFPWGGQLALTNKRLVWAPQSKFERAESVPLDQITESYKDTISFLGSPLLFRPWGLFAGLPLWFLCPARLAIRTQDDVSVYQGLSASEWIDLITAARTDYSN